MNDAAKNDNLRVGWTETPFLSDIYIDNKLAATEVKSRLMTSKLTYDRPKITLFPTDSQYSVLSRHWEMEVRGFTGYINGDKVGEIHAQRSYIVRAQTKHLGPAWTENLITVEPDELYQEHYLHNAPKGNVNEQINFFLTEAKGVRPVSSIEQSYTGEVKPTITPAAILDFHNGWVGKFERHYQYVNTEVEQQKGTFSSSQLVLTLERKGSTLNSSEEVEALGKGIDNLLWYLSFAGRQRVTWVRRASIIKNQLIECTRSIYIPRQADEEELIELWETHEFLQHCLDYMHEEGNLNLYVPLLNLMAAERRGTVESKFMAFYTALEALLFSYASSRNRNKHLNDKHLWEAFRRELVGAINSSKTLLDGDKPAMLQKLGIFNQKSLQSLYMEFCRDFSIDNSDLWPVFHEGFSLSRIRNKLIHGEELPHEQLMAVGIAEENLRWIVERCLLSIIGWKKPTCVTSRGGLNFYTAYNDWKRYFKN